MVENNLTSSIPDFKPCQIICLEHGETCLYAETIQIVYERQMCWVRPLLLAKSVPTTATREIYDLRQSADLVWPIALFRPALDTEAIFLLEQLPTLGVNTEDLQTARQQLRSFLQQVWQAGKLASSDRQSIR
ncbi:MAG: hypothetical protein SW833_02420 [Cyanobacteriota bacterium]|nr:hypothetical protein [Cyanobacteriota bacterium]